MCFKYQRSGMITQYGYPEGSQTFRSLQNGPDDLFIEILDGLDLSFHVPFMTHLIGGLDMDKNQIKLFQGGKGLFGFAAVIRVRISSGPLDGRTSRPA